MNPIMVPGLAIIAQVSTGALPSPPAAWLTQCVMHGKGCTTGGGDFDVGADAFDARLAEDAQAEGPTMPYSDLRRELGLE